MMSLPNWKDLTYSSKLMAHKQGYNARLDESLGARNKTKGKQSMATRRKESKSAEKRAGKPAYSGNKSSTQKKK